MEDIHLAILTITVLAILVADHDGLWYMLGKKQTLNAARLKWLHYGIALGLLGMIVTGTILVWPSASYYFSEPVFLLKMGFVLVLIINSFFIGKLASVTTTQPFSVLSTRQKRAMLISGGASVAGWIGAATIGLFFL